MKYKSTIILSTLAEYQTTFWVEVCLALKMRSYDALVLSFDDRSSELLDRAHIDNFNVPRIAKDMLNKHPVEDYLSVYKRYGVDNPNFWQSHERLVFQEYDKDRLDRKFIGYLLAVDEVFHNQKERLHQAVMVQELGGFISVLASMYVARKYSVDNYYLEPAFFKGRLFSLKNAITAPVVPPKQIDRISEEMRAYIDAAISQRQIVVPEKDRHHYKKAFQKLANLSNVKRLIQKLTDKHLLRKHQEFGYNWVYVGVHIKMFINGWKYKKLYSAIEECGKFIYFPFHVPNDVAITLRSPEYYDQLALIEYLVRIAPSDSNIAVKEHPAMIGAIDARRLIDLLKKYDNLKLIPPTVNNYEVLKHAWSVVTINSKSGAEAAMLGKPVYALGDAFYKNSPLVVRVDRIIDLPAEIGQPSKAIDRQKVEAYFQAVWDKTVPGELYINDPTNIESMTKCLTGIASE